MSLATTEPGVLATARYGKDKVRVFRVVRDPASEVHDVVEYNVTVLVEGRIETRCVHKSTRPFCPQRESCTKPSWDRSYTQADNTVVVATDSSAYSHVISLLDIELSTND
jgi:urate oxidase